MALVGVRQPAQGTGVTSVTHQSQLGFQGKCWTYWSPVSCAWGQPPTGGEVTTPYRTAQGLHPDGIPWQDSCRFFLSAEFASRPSTRVLSQEHQVHCRVLLEDFILTVAGFRDPDPILQLPASLIPSQHY